jgi:hypothetical protein
VTPAEYRAAQGRVQLIAQLILSTPREDFDGLIQSAEHADTLGPFMDPTAWSAGHDLLRLVIDNAQTLRRAQDEIRKAVHRAGVAA